METVKTLSVTVTYKVELGNVEMPEDIYKQISKAFKENHSIKGSEFKYADACEWLSRNIKEGDCFEWETEIDGLA